MAFAILWMYMVLLGGRDPSSLHAAFELFAISRSVHRFEGPEQVQLL